MGSPATDAGSPHSGSRLLRTSCPTTPPSTPGIPWPTRWARSPPPTPRNLSPSRSPWLRPVRGRGRRRPSGPRPKKRSAVTGMRWLIHWASLPPPARHPRRGRRRPVGQPNRLSPERNGHLFGIPPTSAAAAPGIPAGQRLGKTTISRLGGPPAMLPTSDCQKRNGARSAARTGVNREARAEVTERAEVTARAGARRGGRGRRRDDDRPAALGGEREQTDRGTGELREREPREFERARDGREERPARRSEEPRSSEPRSGSRTRDDEPGRRRPPADDDFEALDADSERDQRLQGFDDIEDEADGDRRIDGEHESQDDESRPRKRRRRGRRGGRSRVRGRGDEAPAGDSDRQAGPEDGDDEPLPASYGSRSGSRAEPAARGEDDRSPPAAGETAEGSNEEASSRTRGRRRRRRGDRPRSGAEEPRKAATPERRESSRSRSGDSRRGRTGDARSSSRSRGRRDDFAPVSGRYDEDDEGLEFLGVEEAVRDAAPRARPAEDDDVLTESGLNSVLDVPSWVEAIGIVIAGNLAGRSSRGGRSEGGNGRSR